MFLRFFIFFFSQLSLGEVPSIIPKIKIKGIENIKEKKLKWIMKEKIKSEIIYYFFFKTNLENKLELKEYIGEKYKNWQVNERSILKLMLRLSREEDGLGEIKELQNEMEKTFGESSNLWLGNFLIGVLSLKLIENDPKKNFPILSQIVSKSLNEYEVNKKYKKILFYIAHYYLAEHHLFLMKEYFALKKYNVAIIYGQKVISKFYMHPRATMEALITLIEIFLILDGDVFLDYYREVLLINIRKNPSLKNYENRLNYLLKVYGKENEL